jgi:aminoglycoside phosphotransferase (APT) family kinase protein
VAQAAAIDRRLADYLEAPVASMRILASGWETTVFEFIPAARSPRLDGADASVPLVLRFYEGSRADEKGRREAGTIRALSAANYPVPRPYLFEPDRQALGAPFLVMERVRGGPLFITRNFPQAFKTFSLGFFNFVRAQAQLHRLTPARCDRRQILPAYASETAPESRSLLDRILGVIAERIEQGPLPGLRDALASLYERADHFRIAPESILHLDYHPQNVIVQGLRLSGVIDWVSADCGDRHLCAATTAVILASSAMDHPRWMRDNPIGNSLRTLFAALYFPCYQALAPMQLERFRYYQAVAALLRLSTFGIMRTQGPAAVGFRPEAIANVTPAVVRLLSRYAGRKMGLPVSIEPTPA